MPQRPQVVRTPIGGFSPVPFNGFGIRELFAAKKRLMFALQCLM
jgi:hypothetical protein